MPADPKLNLRGRLLIASPAIGDARFERTVIYMCAHSPEAGAMGIVVNKAVDGVDYKALFDQLQIEGGAVSPLPVYFGGPVETTRGFVLHTSEYDSPDASAVTDDVSLTATMDILRDIAAGEGPSRHILALGYAGWAPGQVEEEIKANGWLIADSDEAILFEMDMDAKWGAALATIGVDPSFLHGEGGAA